MRPHLRPAGALSCSRIGHRTQESDHAEFVHQRRIKGNLIEPIEDLCGRTWRVRPFARVDLQRDRPWASLSRISCAMVGLPVNPPSQYASPSISTACNIVGRQAEASRTSAVMSELREDAPAAGSHLRRGYEQLDWRRSRDAAQQIEAQQTEVIRRASATSGLL
jgi:hypothetical protein